MMISSNDLLIGYDYDAWYGYGERVPIYADATTRNNSHTLICGISGGYVYMAEKNRYCISLTLNKMIIFLI